MELCRENHLRCFASKEAVGTKPLGNVLPVVTNGNVDVVGASDRHVGTTNPHVWHIEDPSHYTERQ